MLPKKNRADKKAVEKIFKEGSFINSANLTFKFVLNNSSSVIPRISFVVPKSVSKLAIKRNLLRRLGYLALTKHLKEFPPLLGVFVFKKYQNDVSIIENEIKNILNKIH